MDLPLAPANEAAPSFQLPDLTTPSSDEALDKRDVCEWATTLPSRGSFLRTVRCLELPSRWQERWGLLRRRLPRHRGVMVSAPLGAVWFAPAMPVPPPVELAPPLPHNPQFLSGSR